MDCGSSLGIYYDPAISWRLEPVFEAGMGPGGFIRVIQHRQIHSRTMSEPLEPIVELDAGKQAVLPMAEPSGEAVGETEPECAPEPVGGDDQTDINLSPSGAEQEQTTGPNGELTTEQVIEAVLFAADTPLSLPKIVSILGVGSAREVKKHIEALNKRYAEQRAAFRIEKIAGGYQVLTLPAFNTWVRRLRQNRQDSRLSQAAMETLAVVAYKQPVVRAEIEAIRGVAAGEMLNRLRELGLIKIVGRAEDVGRPMLYGTTRRFLEVFGLSSLDDLPEVEELQPPSS